MSIKKIKIITLGCDKNTVDSEVLGGQLYKCGVLISPDYTEADAVIINTCGFIDSARKESVMTILEAIEEKKQGKFGKVFVMGCMSERYREDLVNELPEVDNVYGLKEFEKMISDITGENPEDISGCYNERIVLDNDHTAYVRISDGCNHKCSYCSIPLMRGKLISRTEESILEEIKTLVDADVKEIILIGQEISTYGIDIYKEKRINKLLGKISEIVGKDRWIRLMYTYPPEVDRAFIETMAKYDNICNYIDFPIQHSETDLIKQMFRNDTRDTLLEKLKFMREIIPGIAVRTSIITGFPGENRKHFLGLLDFIEKVKFERLGCFPYSPEEGTKAVELPERPLLKTAEHRASEIMEIQQQISFENNQKLIGNIEKVLIDKIDGEYSIGRTYRDAPGIDNEVLIKEKLQTGQFYNVKITDAVEFDLYGEIAE
jgi:ribosomal protein S12 methylthiotransferase